MPEGDRRAGGDPQARHCAGAAGYSSRCLHLGRRITARDASGAWSDIAAGLKSLTETETDQDGRCFIPRSAAAPGVALQADRRRTGRSPEAPRMPLRRNDLLTHPIAVAIALEDLQIGPSGRGYSVMRTKSP